MNEIPIKVLTNYGSIVLARLRCQGDSFNSRVKGAMLPDENITLVRLNNQLCDFSPNEQFFALAFQSNLIVKDSKQLKTLQSFNFGEVIEYIEWSRNSEFVLCANFKKAVVQLFSIYHPQWKYRFIEGSAGLNSVTCAPDSKSILTLSDFNIQITVWSLETQQATHIQNVKSSPFTKLHFTSDGAKLAIIISDDGKDTVEIYKTCSWKLSRKLICERLNSIDGITWSPNGELLAIWCSTSNEPKIIIYSSLLSKNIAVYCPTKSKGQTDTSSEYEKELKGIDNVVWTPSGQLLGVIGFNEMIVLLNHVTWKPLLQLHLDPVIRDNNYLNKVYQEQITDVKAPNNLAAKKKHVLEEEHERPINIRIGTKDQSNKLLIARIEIFEFSACGQYVAIKHQLYPSTLWVWNITSDYLDYLLLQNNITAVKWNPHQSQLLVFCECAHMFEWSPQNAKCIETPKHITVMDGRWNPDGKNLALCGYNKAVIAQFEN